MTQARHFCTYFDRNYLLRGLTMYRSLQATGIDFVLHVLALDEFTAGAIEALGDRRLRCVTLESVENWAPQLRRARANRSKIEYYFTLSPFLPLYLFDTCSEIALVTYVDADLFCYQSPAPIFDELGDRSVLICEHRYSERHAAKLQFGRFNVQLQISGATQPASPAWSAGAISVWSGAMTGWSRTGMRTRSTWMNGRRFTGTIWSWSSTAARG